MRCVLLSQVIIEHNMHSIFPADDDEFEIECEILNSEYFVAARNEETDAVGSRIVFLFTALPPNITDKYVLRR